MLQSNCNSLGKVIQPIEKMTDMIEAVRAKNRCFKPKKVLRDTCFHGNLCSKIYTKDTKCAGGACGISRFVLYARTLGGHNRNCEDTVSATGQPWLLPLSVFSHLCCQ